MVDHLVIAARDLDAGVAYVESKLGLRPVPGGSHPQWGTRNALLGLGDARYLEVIAPDPALPRPASGYPFRIDDLDEPTLVTWAAKADGIEVIAENARAHGYDPGAVFDGARELPNGVTLRWKLTAPQLGFGDGVIPFLIDWGDSPHPANALPVAGQLITFDATYPDPHQILPAVRAIGLDWLRVRPGESAALHAEIQTDAGMARL